MGANATTLSVLVLCSLHDFLMLSTTLFRQSKHFNSTGPLINLYFVNL